MDISIIIPTHNRADLVVQAMHSAVGMDYPSDRYEIIVVDNASTDSTREVVKKLQDNCNGRSLRYVREEQLGLQNARHAGARAAKGEILVFTDDDATFDPGWIQAYAKAFSEHPEMVAAGGPVRPVWEVSPPQWLLECMNDNKNGAKTFPILSLMEPYQEFRLSPDGFFFGVNMAIRRSVFEWTGFRPELRGTRTIGNGESGLNQEISRRGGLIGYVPEAIAYHHIPPHRMTVSYLRKWAWHLGGSQMFERWWKRKRSVPCLSREAISIMRQYWRLWVKDFLLFHRRDPEAIDTQFQASLGWCKLNYVWWMLTDPEVQAALDTSDFRP